MSVKRLLLIVSGAVGVLSAQQAVADPPYWLSPPPVPPPDPNYVEFTARDVQPYHSRHARSATTPVKSKDQCGVLPSLAKADRQQVGSQIIGVTTAPASCATKSEER